MRLCKDPPPLFVEDSQAPCCYTVASNPGPVEFGSCLAVSSLASTPIYERSLLAQWSGPTEYVTLTAAHGSCKANRQHGEVSLIWASAPLALEHAGIFGSQSTIQH